MDSALVGSKANHQHLHNGVRDAWSESKTLCMLPWHRTNLFCVGFVAVPATLVSMDTLSPAAHTPLAYHQQPPLGNLLDKLYKTQHEHIDSFMHQLHHHFVSVVALYAHTHPAHPLTTSD